MTDPHEGQHKWVDYTGHLGVWPTKLPPREEIYEDGQWVEYKPPKIVLRWNDKTEVWDSFVRVFHKKDDNYPHLEKNT